MWPRPCSRIALTASCITYSAPNRFTSSMRCRSARAQVDDLGREQHAGIVDDDVDGAEALDGLAEARRHGFGLRYVGGRDQRFRSELAGLRRDLGERPGATGHQHQVGAGRGECERRLASDAARGPGDEHRPVAERRARAPGRVPGELSRPGSTSALRPRACRPAPAPFATASLVMWPACTFRPFARCGSAFSAAFQPWSASRRAKGSVALFSAKVEVRGTAPGMFATQ